MSRKIAIAKLFKNILTLIDPNGAILDSDQNGFKIVKQGQKTVTLAALTNNQSFNIAHGLQFIPLSHAFAKRTNAAQVFLPNAKEIQFPWSTTTGWQNVGSNHIIFNYVSADISNVTFNFSNDDVITYTIDIVYFLLEKI